MTSRSSSKAAAKRLGLASGDLEGIEPLMVGAYSLMLTTAINAVLGVGFWVLAARLVRPSAVGRESALISALVTLATVGQLNLHNLMIRFLPRNIDRPRRFVLCSYAVAAFATAVLGVLFVIIAPRVSARFLFLERQSGLTLIFVIGAMLWSVFALQDSALTAVRRAPWVLAENSVFGVLKVVAIPVLVALGVADRVFAAWIIPMAVLIIPVNWMLFTRAIPGRRRLEGAQKDGFQWRGLKSFIVTDYAASAFELTALHGLPVVVVALIGSRASAYFYMPFLIIGSFDLLFENVATSLLVEASLHEEQLSHLVRRVLRRFGGLLITGVVSIVVAAPLLLLPFGSAYARHGADALRLLACGSVFRAVLVFYGTVCRVRQRARGILISSVGFSGVLFALTFVFARSGSVNGVALAWVVAAAAAALAALPALGARAGITLPSLRKVES